MASSSKPAISSRPSKFVVFRSTYIPKSEISSTASSSKPVLFSKASNSKPELYSRASTSKPELYSRASASKPELYSRASTSKPELYSRPSTLRPELYARPSTSKSELYSRPSTSKQEFYSRPSTSKADLYSRPSTLKADLYSRPSTSKPQLSSRAYGYNPQVEVDEDENFLTKTKVLTKKKDKRPLEEIIPSRVPAPKVSGPRRRPPRRAAVIAAKKIHDDVQNYEARLREQRSEAAQQRIKKSQIPITLELVCEEEVLSSVQTKVQRAAADAYNKYIMYVSEMERQGHTIIHDY